MIDNHAATLPNVLIIRYSSYWCGPLLERAGKAYLVIEEDGTYQGPPAEHVTRYERVYRISSFQSIEELSAVAADLLFIGADINKVVTYAEHTQYAGGYVAHLLGLDTYRPGLALNTRDKRMMKTRAAAAGLPVPRHLSLPNAGRDADLDRVEAEVNYPLVLKPANGWGTVSTTMVRDRAELSAALTEGDLDDELCSDHLVLEEFITGDEYHVDAVWRDGKPWVFFVSRYFAPRLDLNRGVGLNGSILLWEEDHPDLYREIRELNTRYNGAVGLTRGATHLEVFQEHGTGRLVASELASRMGGAIITEVVGVACGVSERVLWAHELLDGRLEDLPPLGRAYDGQLGWLNIPPTRSGRVRAVPTREEILAHPTVVDVNILVEPGDEIPVAWPSTFGILIILGAETEDQLIKAAEEVTGAFAIEVG